MPSSNLIGDIGTVITNGPSATTTTNAIDAAGEITDYPGVCKLIKLKLQEADVLLTQPILTNTDAGTDATNHALITGVIHALEGLGSPATTLLADLNTVLANGEAAATTANNIAAAGEIVDYPGVIKLCINKLKEVLTLIGSTSPSYGLLRITAASDDSTNRNLLIGIGAVLV